MKMRNERYALALLQIFFDFDLQVTKNERKLSDEETQLHNHGTKKDSGGDSQMRPEVLVYLNTKEEYSCNLSKGTSRRRPILMTVKIVCDDLENNS